jgi:hypothetical protein
VPLCLTVHEAFKHFFFGICTPHAVFMKEHPQRLQRLYDQLVPFGTSCNVTLTNAHLPKLAPRSVPVFVVGTGPALLNIVSAYSKPKVSRYVL